MRRRQFIGLVGALAAVPVLRPLSARAQQAGRPHRIAYLALLSGEDATFAKPLLQRLEELGYREGKNMIWDYRSAEGRVERLPQLAAEIVGTSPDVLITGFGTLAPKAAIAATRSIPIVFTSVGDPVGAGLVASLGQPGGNVTGMSGQASDIAAKKLQLLDDLIPGKKLVAVLGNPDTPYTALACGRSRQPPPH
jgi:putative ABC transport system substrate-binding protein